MKRKPMAPVGTAALTALAAALGWPLLAASPAPHVVWPPAGYPTETLAPDATPDEVMAVVRRLFDGMREADSAKVRSVFAEGARFAGVVDRAGTQALQYTPVDGFVTSVGRSERRWDERIFDVEVRVDDGMAVVWAPYTFYLDGEIRHCGVNSMDFLRTNGTWKIIQLNDTRRMDGCRQVPPGQPEA
jgi:hypothetical protein